jgi:hypothetical protein
MTKWIDFFIYNIEFSPERITKKIWTHGNFNH